MDDYVRYFYLVHKQTDGKPQTTEMHLMYKKEGGKQSSYKKHLTVTAMLDDVDLYYKILYTVFNRNIFFSAASKAPENFTVNVVTNSAVLHWKPIPVQDQQGFLTHYEVCYTRSQNNGAHVEIKSKVILLTR